MTDATTTATGSQADASTTTADGQPAPGTQQQAQAPANATGAQATSTEAQTTDAATADAALAARWPGFAQWPAEAQAAIRARDNEAQRYQREAGDQRINAKNQAAQDGARKALAEAAKLAGLEIPGLTDTDKGDADPKVLAQTIAQTTTERDDARKSAALTRAAVAQGADPAKLDYLEFKLGRDATYRGLSVDAADFSAKLAASITAELAADATLRRTGTAQASGVETLGGSNGSDAITPERFARMTVQERQDLYFSDKPLYDRLVAGQ